MARSQQLPKGEPALTTVRVQQDILTRFNPLRNLTPQKVVRMLEEYDRGVLREVAWMMDKVERLDDMTKTVASKRKKALGRLDWSIKPYESWEELGTPRQLENQQKFLRGVYNNVRATHAQERNIRGGIQKAVVQMADAIGKGYAAHELSWETSRSGNLSLSMTFIPLWYFENTTGELRFLPTSGSATGVPLAENQWMVTVGEGLMLATLVAYIYKTLPLKDWLTYSERCGMPFPTMATDATPGSKEWDQAAEALAQVGRDFAALHSRNAEFKIHDLRGSGEMPYPKLVERMDRAIAILWRGSDLGTMSGEDKVGASLQQGESDILIEDDVQMVNETLEFAVSLPALRYRFGQDVQPMCYFALHAPDRLDEKAEQDKMHKAADYGVRIPVSDYRERMNIPGGEDDRDAVLVPPASAPSLQPGFNPMANAVQLHAEGENAAAYRRNALERLINARQQDLAPVLAAVDELERETDPDAFAGRLATLEQRLTELLPDPSTSETAKVIEAILGGALVSGAVTTLEHDD